MNKLVLFAVIVGICLCGEKVTAQDQPSQTAKQGTLPGTSPKSDVSQTASDHDLQLLRKDVRSLKRQIVAANMDLTDAQAVKFWPVYDQYTADVTRINDTKVALIQEYSQTYDTMNGDQAEDYLRKRAAVEESIMQLRN
jgi:hypothetical protein